MVTLTGALVVMVVPVLVMRWPRGQKMFDDDDEDVGDESDDSSMVVCLVTIHMILLIVLNILNRQCVG